MKALLLSAFVLGGLAAAAVAEPVALSDAHMDEVVAGRIKIDQPRIGFSYYDSVTGQVVVVEPTPDGGLTVVPQR